MAIAVLLFAIVAESISLWGCLREVNKERHGRSMFQWFRQSRSSALIVVFGEDIAALLGLVFALAAITATYVTGNPLWDALGTIMIGVLLIVIAFFRCDRGQGFADWSECRSENPGGNENLPWPAL